MNLRFTLPKTLTALLATACILGHGAVLHADTSHLVVTEINSNAEGGDFWELTNVGTTAVSLSNFKWDDDSQNASDAAAVTVPAGTSIAAGESIIFAVGTAAAFRAEWGTLPGVQIISGGPGLGGGDGVTLFDAAGTKLFFFSYGANGFTRSSGSGSAGGHAGASAGGADSQSAVIDPNFGVGSGRRYAVATAGTFGAYAGTSGGQNIGSPGYTGLTSVLLTELNSNAAGGDFWELTNVGTVPAYVGGWKWTDEARAPGAADAVSIPVGTSLAVGESIVLTNAANVTTFRNGWGGLAGVQVFGSSSGEPGLGSNDGVALFNASNRELFFFDYEAGKFTRSNGSASLGGHAGLSAGGTSNTQSVVIDPAFGHGSGLRFTAATVGALGAFANGSSVGSPGTTGLTLDSGSITLALSITPSTFSENATNPAATGTVSRATAGTTDLTVSLSSSDTTEATVPATVTILANQTTATFSVAAVNDTAPDGSQTVTITATATGANAPTASVSVQDDGDVAETAFLLTEIQSNQSAGKPTGADDYWELTNISGVSRDISGYSWHDGGRSSSAAAAYKLPAGTTIAAGESVIFTNMAPAAFRAWWGITNATQVFQSTAPGLGQGDGVSFFDAGGNEIFFLSYAAAGFTKADGSPSTGGHAGPSAGGSADSQALVWVPSSGTSSPRYTFATGSSLGTFSAVSPATDLGSPGNQGVVVPTVSIADASVNEGNSGTSTLALTVTRSDTATAFTVGYSVTGGTATSGTDYATLSSGTLTFINGGPATQAIDISVNGDTTSEPDETVVVTLSNVVNTTGATIIGTAAGTGTIVNDDVIAPVITTHPTGTTIASGSTTLLSVAASGFPAPTYQWYAGSSGNTTSPVGGATSSSFTTPALTATTSYWARATNTGGFADSNTATVTVSSGVVAVDLATYVRVGRYNLPEYRRTALPAGTASHNLLCDEASGVAYNWDTDTLFICGDGGKAITQVTKTGQLVDTMSLEL
ncbi:MAG: lamin tail domain-containing protein, partial [Prosthecobacter sp.]